MLFVNYLIIIGKLFQQYHKRWIVISDDDNKLYSFKIKQEYSNATDIINIIDIIDQDNEEFYIITPKNNLDIQFKASSIYEKNEWINCIQNILNKHVLIYLYLFLSFFLFSFYFVNIHKKKKHKTTQKIVRKF